LLQNRLDYSQGTYRGAWEAIIPNTLWGRNLLGRCLGVRKILKHPTTITPNSCLELKGKEKSVRKVDAEMG